MHSPLRPLARSIAAVAALASPLVAMARPHPQCTGWTVDLAAFEPRLIGSAASGKWIFAAWHVQQQSTYARLMRFDPTFGDYLEDFTIDAPRTLSPHQPYGVTVSEGVGAFVCHSWLWGDPLQCVVVDRVAGFPRATVLDLDAHRYFNYGHFVAASGRTVAVLNSADASQPLRVLFVERNSDAEWEAGQILVSPVLESTYIDYPAWLELDGGRAAYVGLLAPANSYAVGIAERDAHGVWHEVDVIPQPTPHHLIQGRAIVLSGHRLVLLQRLAALPGWFSAWVYERAVTGVWGVMQRIDVQLTDLQGYGVSMALDENRLVIGDAAEAQLYELDAQGLFVPTVRVVGLGAPIAVSDQFLTGQQWQVPYRFARTVPTPSGGPASVRCCALVGRTYCGAAAAPALRVHSTPTWLSPSRAVVELCDAPPGAAALVFFGYAQTALSTLAGTLCIDSVAGSNTSPLQLVDSGGRATFDVPSGFEPSGTARRYVQGFVIGPRRELTSAVDY